MEVPIEFCDWCFTPQFKKPLKEKIFDDHLCEECYNAALPKIRKMKMNSARYTGPLPTGPALGRMTKWPDEKFEE
jgi:hypothetical protein